MTKYAAVAFSPEEAGEYREFLRAMTGAGIISLSNEEIEATIETFSLERADVMNRMVLANEEQENRFRNWMNAFFKEKEYKITDDPDDPEYSLWLREHGGV